MTLTIMQLVNKRQILSRVHEVKVSRKAQVHLQQCQHAVQQHCCDLLASNSQQWETAVGIDTCTPCHLQDDGSIPCNTVRIFGMLLTTYQYSTDGTFVALPAMPLDLPLQVSRAKQALHAINQGIAIILMTPGFISMVYMGLAPAARSSR